MTVSQSIPRGQQLLDALEAFARYRKLDDNDKDWASRNHANLQAAGICSMDDLRQACREDTLNLDLEFFGLLAPQQVSFHEYDMTSISVNSESSSSSSSPSARFDEETISALLDFLPGPIGFRCFRLAQQAAQHVKVGSAHAKYVHRLQSGALGPEKWHVVPGDRWTLHVDCAGFIRNTLKHVTKSAFRMELSDRDFMRAKDFYSFFHALPDAISLKERVNDCSKRSTQSSLPEGEEEDRKVEWRRVDDLRLVIPGDIISYRPQGHAAGGAAFTENDRKDLTHLLRAVKTADLWHQERKKGAVTRNLAKDPSVQQFITVSKRKLRKVDVTTVKGLRRKLLTLEEALVAVGEDPFGDFVLTLIKECSMTRAVNTGHIVFVAGPAIQKGANEYRIRVVHSTKSGHPDSEGNPTEGVQEWYRRFRLVQDENGVSRWTRSVALTPPIVDEVECARGNLDDVDSQDDTIVDDDSEDEADEEEDADDSTDSMDEPLRVEVIAARMCF